MNPFINDENDNLDVNVSETPKYKIEIWVEQTGKRYKTYLTGWLDNKKELENHLSILKRKHGCNGTVKYNNENKICFQLSGNKKDLLFQYLLKQNISKDNITFTG